MLLIFFFLENDHAGPSRPDTPEPHRGHLLAVLKNHRRIFLIAGAAQLFAQMIRAGRQAILPLYGADTIGLDVATIGVVISAGTALDVLMVYPAGILMDKFGRKWAIVPCFAIQAFGMLLVPFSSDVTGLLLAALIMGFGNGLGSGTMMTVGADLAPAESHGEFLGVWRLIGDIGVSGGPMVVGIVADIVVLPAAALVMTGAGLAAALIFGLFVPETLEKRNKRT